MIRWSCQRLHGCVPVAASAALSGERELVQLRAPLGHVRHGLGERLAAPGADLDLGRDQLADEMLLERGRPARPPETLRSGSPAPASRGSRIANSSSTATVKSLPFSYASNAERICSSGRELLCVAHGAPTLLAREAVPPRSPSSSARRRPCAPPGRALCAARPGARAAPRACRAAPRRRRSRTS